MPKPLHDKLEQEYKNLPEKKREHAIYGTMNKVEEAQKKRHKREKKRGR